MTSVMLRQKGYKVFDAATGDEALKIASSCREKIDLVITDVVMPGMNGKELYNEIAKIIPDVDVLFVSGYPMEIISHHGILEEGLNFLSKPVTIDDFTKKIRDILDKKKCL
jgi:response regulator RpfG family c-di-GMP phosphodiesterase